MIADAEVLDGDFLRTFMDPTPNTHIESRKNYSHTSSPCPTLFAKEPTNILKLFCQNFLLFYN